MAKPETECDIDYQISPAVINVELNTLFAAAWPDHTPTEFTLLLKRSLLYVCAYSADCMIGFVNVAWDGGCHAFLLDTTVHPNYQRRGIGRRLVETAAEECRQRGVTWLHVDFEPHLRAFYTACGFLPTEAGLMQLSARKS